MKKLAIGLLGFASCVFGQERVFIHPDWVTFGEEGMFLATPCREIPLAGVHYDEQARSYYIYADNRVTLIWCSYCGNQTWWVEERCCLSRGYDCIWECKRKK